MFSTNKSGLIPIDTPVLFGLTFLLLTMALLVILTKKFRGNRIKMLGLWSLAWLVLAAAFLGTGVFGRVVDVSTINTKTYTMKELTEDLGQLEKCLLEENPLYFADKNELKQLFLSAYGEIKDGMTELEFYRLVNPIIVAVGCGHTNLSVSEALIENRKDTAQYFPLRVTLVDDQLYFLEGDIECGVNAGDKILSINGKTDDEIINTLIGNVSGDSYNEQKPRYIISKHFNNKFYDFIDNTGSFAVEIGNDKADIKKVILHAKYSEEFNKSAWDLHFTGFEDGNYYEGSIEDDYAVLKVSLFMQEEGVRFTDYLEEFFSKLKGKSISKLIIDVRGNYGGTPIAKALLSHLVNEEIEYFQDELPLLHKVAGYTKPVTPADTTFDGDVVVLTDGAGFSTTAHFCALVKHHNLGTLVGSETGATYVCTDSSKDTVLNNTRLRLHYSTLAYRVAVDGMSEHEGVKPDIRIAPTIEDILNDRDVQMEAALQFLKLR